MTVRKTDVICTHDVPQHSSDGNGVNAACHDQASTSTNGQPDDVSLAACNVIGDHQVAPSR